MNNRYFAVASLTLAAALVCVALPAAGQTDSRWPAPRTADGHPDLQGVWANNSATPLERPDAWAGKTHLTDEELASLQSAAADVVASGEDAQFGDQLVLAAIERVKDADSYDTTGNYNQFWIVDRNFDNRTSLIVAPPDGKVPALTPEAEQRRSARRAYQRDHPADSHLDRSSDDRCITYGVPRISAGYNSYFQIFQSPTHVAILQEMIHEVRVIPISDQPRLPEHIRQVTGNSRAHWDGETLVVETTNYSPTRDVQGSTEQVTTVERFTRVGPDTLNWEVTFTDPRTWTEPWTVMIALTESEEAIFEYACHEGNYSMEGVLAGHRAEERTDAATDSR